MDVTQNIVILTGAGVSADSGVSTFRDNGGLWDEHRVEDVATPEAFVADPELVHNFYNMRRSQLTTIEPNDAHWAIAVLERLWKGNFLLVTQNVDNLHERAGSNALIHMHGELVKARCIDTAEIVDWVDDITVDTLCACCKKKGNLRPHIVWFGEMPLEMERIYHALNQCDIFISIGTSGNVYPAAGFVQEAKFAGKAQTIELNLEASGSPYFDDGVYGKAKDIVPAFFRERFDVCPD